MKNKRMNFGMWFLVVAVAAGFVFQGSLFAADQKRGRKLPADQMNQGRLRKALLENTTVYKDIVYGSEDEKSQSLDVYVPNDAGEQMPLIVWIHGGGWRSGDKAACRAIDLLGEGYVVASINYRLTDVATFPAQIHDCKAAIRYLRANAIKYNIDPKRVGVWGSSAGGHLVALLGVSNGNKDLEGKVGQYPETSSDVQAVCDWFGPTDFFTMALGRAASNNGQDPVFKLFGGTISEKKELAELCSPATHVSKKAPPFLIMHGDVDKLVPVEQSEMFQEKLKAAGVDSTLIILEGQGHGFVPSKEVIEPVVKFFERTLKSQEKNTAKEQEKKK